jgi:hypothetical protein
MEQVDPPKADERLSDKEPENQEEEDDFVKMVGQFTWLVADHLFSKQL